MPLHNPGMPRCEAAFHKTIANATAPDGKVDMWQLMGAAYDPLVTIAVPHGRNDIALFIARACNLLSDGLRIDAATVGDALRGRLQDTNKLTESEIAGALIMNALLAENKKALEMAHSVVDEWENLEDRAPADPDCGVCNLGTGPHKRTCAYHLAKDFIERIEGRAHYTPKGAGARV